MRLHLNMGIIGETPQIPKMRDPTRQEIANRISEIDLDDSIKHELLQKLASYPDGALTHFRDNLRNMIINLRKKSSQERNNDNLKSSPKEEISQKEGEISGDSTVQSI